VLRRISVPKQEEVTGGWKIYNNNELENFYFSKNIIIMMKSKRKKRAWDR
jgi:hypothetical protein